MTEPDCSAADQRELIPADRRARWMTLVLAVVVLLAGGVFAWWLRRYQMRLVELVAIDRPAALASAMRLFDALAWVCSVPLFVLAAWCAVLTGRIRRSGCFPPPGMRVLRDTVCRRGAAAQRIAYLAAAAGMFSLAAGVAMFWMLRAAARIAFAN
ncbi:MAG: hypothetical protein MUF48_04950 [Pirellulaceae bacterium]|jgi:hypothetical protein|nr:hypothetical protein [Pirellulaceae bacterium]